MAVTIGPQPQHTGGLSHAIDLWDRFMGPESQLRAQSLRNMQQQYEINAATEKRAEELHGPNLQTANAVAGVHQNELAKSNTDEATRKGSIAALNQAPVTMWKPTTDMNDQELQQWWDLHSKNGVTDRASAAQAWNAGMGSIKGRFPTPAGGIPQQYSTGPDGKTTVGGMVYDPSKLPNLDSVLGPSAPGAPAPAVPGAPSLQTLPAKGPDASALQTLPGSNPQSGVPLMGSMTPLQAPATPAAPAQAGGTALPQLGSLARIAANPYGRALVENAIKMQGDIAANQEKQQQLEKGQRDVDFGTPEERQKEQDFVRNAAEMSHRLQELRSVVEKNGNYPYGFANPEAAAKVGALPMQIADNWQAVAGKQGVLRPEAVEQARENLMPFPHHWWTEPFVPNKETLAGIDHMQNVLADYVRQHENAPTTKQPVTGLSPEVRKLVGQTKFGKPEDIRSENSLDHPTPSTEFKGMDDFQAASKAGQVDVSKPVKIGGVTYVPGPSGWEPQTGATNAPAKPMTPEQAAADAAMRQNVLPLLGPLLFPH